jgi:hypothetical protein
MVRGIGRVSVLSDVTMFYDLDNSSFAEMLLVLYDSCYDLLQFMPLERNLMLGVSRWLKALARHSSSHKLGQGTATNQIGNMLSAPQLLQRPKTTDCIMLLVGPDTGPSRLDLEGLSAMLEAFTALIASSGQAETMNKVLFSFYSE